MDNRYVVCKEVGKRGLGICIKCDQPCHSKCAIKKRERLCNLCYNAEQPSSRAVSRGAKQTSAHSRVSGARTTTLVTNSTVKPVAVTLAPATTRASVGRHSSQQAPVTNRRSTAGDVDVAAVITEPVNAVSEEKAVNTAVAAVVAADGVTVTVTPTADDELNHFSCEVPPGEASLIGLSHVLIPVSTMDLFFRRFDMLQAQLDELKSLLSQGPDSRSVYSILSNGGAAVDVANLTARVSALEGGLVNHSVVLGEMVTNTRLLLDATEGLKDDLRKVHDEIENIHGACWALETKLDDKLDSGPPPTIDSLPGSIPDSGIYVGRSPRSFLVSGGVGARYETTECREIAINGILRNDYEISQEFI